MWGPTRAHLGHEHLQEALFEVADLCPHVIVGLARAGHMVQGHNEAVSRHQPTPDSRSTKSSITIQFSDEAKRRGKRDARLHPHSFVDRGFKSRHMRGNAEMETSEDDGQKSKRPDEAPYLEACDNVTTTTVMVQPKRAAHLGGSMR